MSNKYSRRMVLRGLGGCTLAIPFLPSLLPREAWAQSPSVHRRYFSIVGNYDYGHHRHWYPTLQELSQVVDPSNGDQQFRYQPLTAFATQSQPSISRIIGSGFYPYLRKMNIFRGLNLHSRIAHGRGHMLGNVAATDGHDNQVVRLKPLPTIDRVLAANTAFNPGARSPLHWGMDWSYFKNADGSVSQRSANFEAPHSMFNRIFRNVLETGDTQTQPPHPRRDILSRVFADYQRVSKGRHISSVDKNVLENAMARYSDILGRLAGTQSVSGCSFRYLGNENDPQTLVGRSRNFNMNPYSYNPESTDQKFLWDLYAQIYAAAAACDLTRVFSFHINIADHFDRHPGEDFHQGHSHQPWTTLTINGAPKINHEWMADIWRMYFDEFVAKLVRYLDEHTESNGMSILDNSLVHATIESSQTHCDFSKPCLFIGGAGGALTTGHYIDYSRRDLGPHREQGDNFDSSPTSARFGNCYFGQHYNRSLTTILRAMGLSPSAYEDPDINTFFQARTDGLLGPHNNGVARIGGYGHIGSQNNGTGGSNSDLYNLEYARYNYHFYKESLPMPTRSAA